ncbi:MAG: hypothetical protein EBS05_21420 [Proteobacteria bacterium]|nr:hypothetical protein [Pseudomonadota bacterium]
MPPPAPEKQPVRVEISIPPVQTRVVGDATPLIWRFTNTSTQALAFMWEGCCRNNGKVEMRRQGPPPPITGVLLAHNGPGPGIYSPKCEHCKQTRKLGEITVESTVAGPALAHQFARAVRLAPGATQEFSTQLADWVKAEFTGDYKVRAQYLGVSPKQRPQMPRGVPLWNGRTTSTELDVSLLSVADYLVERPARETTRQVRMELAGPARLVPFQPTPLKIKLINHGPAEQRLDWPACLDLWITTTNGLRIVPASEPNLGAAESLIVPSGGTVEREIPFSHELLVGEPFGSYQVFVDLRETTNALRVPSPPITLTWQLDRELVTQLIRDSADKPLTGARNAPLKLLRLYLGEIAGPLRAVKVTALTPAAAKLTADLRTATVLKPMAPRPGRVDLSMRVPPDGKFAFTDAALVAAFADRPLSPAGQFGEVIALRRHLGWDLAVSLKPEPSTSLQHVATALAAISPLHANLDNAPSATIFNADSTAFSAVTFPAAVIPANLVVRLSRTGSAVKLAVARRLPDPQRPGVESMFTAAEVVTTAFTPLPDATALEALLADGQLAAPRPLVLVAPDLAWSELAGALGPLLNRGLAFDLVVQ